MHIEPGVVDGAKIVLSYVTAAGAIGYAAKLAVNTIKQDGATPMVMRSAIATLLVFSFFQVFPHYPMGISEVHLILGSSLFLMFGVAPAALGLAAGLLAQGLLFAPHDLPQYGMNVTTLLVPLMALSALARRIIPEKTAYKDVQYSQCLALSTAFQAGVVAWVGFWAVYGQGVGAENLSQIGTFGVAYMSVILIEPLLDLALLAAAKALHQLKVGRVFQPRMYQATA